MLVDVETGQAIDVLPERTADALVTWLEAHEGVEVICRDRGGCYSEGATREAPAAVQVADRWHLWSVRREALIDRVGVRDLRRCPVAAGR